MKPGEYVGKDGRTYRWAVNRGCGYDIKILDEPSFLRAADWPAARAALDALIEAEAREWVEMAEGEVRIRENGSSPQRLFADCVWEPAGEDEVWPEAYRKGVEVRDRIVQELVWAVGADDSPMRDDKCGGVVWAGSHTTLDTAWVERVRAAAKKVKL